MPVLAMSTTPGIGESQEHHSLALPLREQSFASCFGMIETWGTYVGCDLVVMWSNIAKGLGRNADTGQAYLSVPSQSLHVTRVRPAKGKSLPE